MANTAYISTDLGSIRILRAKNGWVIVDYDAYGVGQMPVQMVAETPEGLSQIIIDWARRQAAPTR